jgi:hypothetical protein
MGQTGNFEMTVIERIDMVNLLKSASKSEKKANSGKGATSEKGAALEKIEPVEDQPAKPAPKANGSQPDSIEQQMQTAMTATVKEIGDVDISPGVDEDESEDNKSGGLFSHFKRQK